MPFIAPAPRRPPRRRRATPQRPPLHDQRTEHSTYTSEQIDVAARIVAQLDDPLEVMEELVTQAMLLDFANQPIIVPKDSTPVITNPGDASYVPGAQREDNPARADLGGLAQNTYDLKMAVAAAFQINPKSIGGRAYRPYKSDHTTGHAIDIPGSGQRGDTTAAWVIERASAYKVKYIIFNYRIWYPGRGWQPYTPSSAVKGFASDAGHVRHVHVSTY